eukprot:3742339-Heterocapsa_arctica.AAC.1
MPKIWEEHPRQRASHRARKHLAPAGTSRFAETRHLKFRVGLSSGDKASQTQTWPPQVRLGPSS